MSIRRIEKTTGTRFVYFEPIGNHFLFWFSHFSTFFCNQFSTKSSDISNVEQSKWQMRTRFGDSHFQCQQGLYLHFTWFARGISAFTVIWWVICASHDVATSGVLRDLEEEIQPKPLIWWENKAKIGFSWNTAGYAHLHNDCAISSISCVLLDLEKEIQPKPLIWWENKANMGFSWNTAQCAHLHDVPYQAFLVFCLI